MALQKFTIELPDSVYQRIAALAKKSQRPVAEETISLIQSALYQEQKSSLEINELLDQLSFLTDAELLNAARSSATVQDEELMQGLLEKQQREGLTASESEQAESLSQRFNQIMLVRAKSAALLVERGFDAAEILPA